MKYLLVGSIFCFLLLFDNLQPALASIHKYPESATQTMYRSQQSLRDDRDRAWQLILFKRLKFGQLDSVHLRLVGFPGKTEVARAQPLKIAARTKDVWTANNLVEQLELPANVGEYDLLKVMTELDADLPLQLELSLQQSQVAKLLVPPFVVREWRSLMDEVEIQL
jgi:Protein of unknown function (DUF3122)